MRRILKRKYINRAIAILLIICLLTDTNPLALVLANNPFAQASDDYSSHWAASYIRDLIDRGVVVGYENGEIRPDNKITRAEFVTSVNKAFDHSSEGIINFPDVDHNAWYARQFRIARYVGYLFGDERGFANPGQNITRAEVAVLFTNMLTLEPVSHTASFIDANEIPAWALNSIIAMYEHQYVFGYPDNTYRPANNLTRAEGFAIIARIRSLVLDDDADAGLPGEDGDSSTGLPEGAIEGDSSTELPEVDTSEIDGSTGQTSDTLSDPSRPGRPSDGSQTGDSSNQRPPDGTPNQPPDGTPNQPPDGTPNQPPDGAPNQPPGRPPDHLPPGHIPEPNVEPELEISVVGELKVNRKLTISGSSSTGNPSDYETLIAGGIPSLQIKPLDQNIPSSVIFIDDDTSQPDFIELIIKQAGRFEITLNIERFGNTETITKEITIEADIPPVAYFTLENVFYRDSSRSATVTIEDASYSLDGDAIATWEWTVIHDRNNNGCFLDDEPFHFTGTTNGLFTYIAEEVGRYQVTLTVTETIDNTIPKFLFDDDFLSSTSEPKIFEVRNQAPSVSGQVSRAMHLDIAATFGNVSPMQNDAYTSALIQAKENLENKGVSVRLSGLGSNIYTPMDTFDWEVFERSNYSSIFLPEPRPHSIIRSGSDIQMLGYTIWERRNFLFMPSSDPGIKTFRFDLVRDGTDWHSMLGGGFLFNTTIEDDTIEGYAILVTDRYLVLHRIYRTSIHGFENTIFLGTVLASVPMEDTYARNSFEIVVSPREISVWNNGNLLIDRFMLPVESKSYGFGPIAAFRRHWCEQISYFVFSNLTMETGQSITLAQAINEYEWRSSGPRALIHFSDDAINDFAGVGSIGRIAEAINTQGINYIAAGNGVSSGLFDDLLNNTVNSAAIDDSNTNSLAHELTELLWRKIQNDIGSDPTVFTTDYYIDYPYTFTDPEDDPFLEERFRYQHDISRFSSNLGEIDGNGIFGRRRSRLEKVGDFEIYLQVSDAPSEVWELTEAYSEWSDEAYLGSITVHRRPIALLEAVLSAGSDDDEYAVLELIDLSFDPDHPHSQDAGIVLTDWRWKNLNDVGWTLGQPPRQLPFENEYIIYYRVRDIDRSWSYPASIYISTLGMTTEVNNEPPDIILDIDRLEWRVGEEVRFEASANARGNDEISSFEVYVDGRLLSTSRGRQFFTATTSGIVRIEVVARDTSGNEARRSITITLSGQIGPQIILHQPRIEVIRESTPIIVTVTGSAGISSWSLEHKLPGTDNFVILNQGSQAIYEETIGNIDPDSLVEGHHEYRVIAVDTSGNSTRLYLFIYIYIGQGTLYPPTVEIISPSHQDIVMGYVDIVGTVSSETALESYELKLIALNGSETILAHGTEDIVSGVLATWDTTSVADGTYQLELSAINEASLTNFMRISVIVDNSDDYDDGPVLEFISPRNGDTVSGIVPIQASITDERGIYSYELEISGPNITEFESVASGSGNITGELFSWDTTILPVGVYAIRLTAVNSAGIQSSFTIMVSVVDGTAVSEVELIVNNGMAFADIHSEIPIRVIASGLFDLSTLVIRVNDDEIAVGGDGTASFTPDEVGIYVITASIRDESGNETVLEFELRVIDPDDDSHPTVEIFSPTDASIITAPTEIIGTVSEEGLVRYTLEYAPGNSTDFTLIAEGIHPVENDVLGKLDTSLMRNGYYTIRLTGYGARLRVVHEIVVSVEGQLKIGNFSIAFIDMEFPAHGFPLTVTREYDSRDRNRSGDFGNGWNLSLSGATISESVVPGLHWRQNLIQGQFGMSTYVFAEDRIHQVSIDWGNGRTEKFEMRLSPASQPLVPILHSITAYFVPIGTTRSTLEAIGNTTNLVFNDGAVRDQSTMMPFNPGRYRLTTEDGTVFVFNVESGVESITDTLGNTIRIDHRGVHHSDGRSIVFTRDDMDRITSITGPNGEEVSYIYDGAGDLVEFIDVGGRSIKYEYDRDSFLIDIIDPRGIRVTRNEFDDDGRLVAVVDAEGNRMTFDNNVAGRRQAVTDRLGNTTLFVYDDWGNILSLTDALGNTVYNEFDSNRNISSHRDALGNVTRFEYSPDGRLLSLTNAMGQTLVNEFSQRNELISISTFGMQPGRLSYNEFGQVTQTTDPLGNSINYNYQSDGRLRSITDDIGLIMQFTYDSDGNVVAMTDGAHETITFTYDVYGNPLTKTITRRNQNGVNETLTESYQYDIFGNITRTILSDGSFISYEYDQIGNIVAIVDSVGRRTTFNYDLFGNLTRINYYDNTFESFEYDAENRNTRATDRYGQTVTMAYDRVGNLTSITHTNGSVEYFVYDAKQRIIATIDVAGAITRYEYDSIDRNTAIIDALGNRTEFTYNEYSQLSEFKDPRGYVTRFQYDLNGNRTRVTLADGNSISSEFDARGRLISQTDQNGHTTQYKYDGLNRLIGIVDAMGGEWIYTYNSVNELVAVTDPNGNTTYYKYDDHGRVIMTTNAAGHESINTFDERGNLVATSGFNGIARTFEYDSSDRLIGVIAGSNSIDFTYNANNQIETVTDKNGITRYTYDIMDNMISVEKPDGLMIQYVYDMAGRIISRITPFGSTHYTYDILSRLKSVTDRDGAITTYNYDASGNLISVEYSNGMTTTYTYNPANALTNMVITNRDGEVVREYTYTLGRAGERLRVEESTGRIVEYEYDALYRLVRETVTENSVTETTTFVYDAASNRILRNENGVETAYTYNSLNQLIYETGITYEYDLNGNRTRKTEGARVTSFTFDEFDRLIRATIQEGQNVNVEEYRYDWLGNRIEKRGELSTVRYLVDTNNWIAHVIAETDESGTLLAFYTRGDDVLINMDRGGNKFFYLYDGHGSVRMLANENNFITDTYTFNAFGELTFRTGVTENNYLYAGEQFDWLTQMYYLRARYMDPSTGTFISMDPFQGFMHDPISLHRYLYAHANPITNTDPTGLVAQSELTTVVAIQGILNSIKTGMYTAIKLAIRHPLKTFHLVMSTRNLLQAIDSRDPSQIALALASGFVSVATFFSMCKLATVANVMTRALAAVSLYDQSVNLATAIQEGNIFEIAVACLGMAIVLSMLTAPCFTGDTPVLTEDGKKRIDEIEVGDKVWAFDVETGEKELREVLEVFVNQSFEILYLELSDEIVETTTNHPFYVVGNGWVAAGDLAIGDPIYTIDGNSSYVLGLYLDKLNEPVVVYNLEVDGLNTYFVGSGFLVHNTCSPRKRPRTTGEHSRILRRTMEAEGVVFAPRQVPGHIVASGGRFGRWAPAIRSRNILNRYGIGVNHAANGIPIGHPRPHNVTHTGQFHSSVLRRLNNVEVRMLRAGNSNRQIRSGLLSELRLIGKEVLNVWS